LYNTVRPDYAGDKKMFVKTNDTPAPPPEWPARPLAFGGLLTPVEAAQYLRLDETGRHTPLAAIRTLDYFRGRDDLRATKFARQVWYRRDELDEFLKRKTEG